MKFHFAEHLDSFEAGIFAILNEKKEELLRPLSFLHFTSLPGLSAVHQ